jgi:transcriptional regulator with XRE-family HTH domain
MAFPSPHAEQGDFSNKLRQRRAEAKITRLQIVERCDALEKEDPKRFVKVSLSTLKRLEGAKNKPRFKTAVTLAAVLNLSADDVFPQGYDDPNRNPDGITRITENHRKNRAST